MEAAAGGGGGGAMAGSLSNVAAAQSTSLQRLYHVQKRIVHTVQLAGGVMEELGNLGGSRADVVASQCREFMQSVKVREPYLI
ncbi:hypothetical protein O6H91_05G065500 [Diphasiastrum complanatum]|uniref:Uncharacterized protein n=1 Tax=Diphasiastrum complanatum TaxID=34168 RepID=A0ACC2DPV5_DIPCM|nr:hypothetical protein O6H91_Y033900 [Diphasiastrum complanatum]KAJ7556022.1 hypothetical protein O6H91_05G065500 [Diphasiastrum complanatum]